MWPSKLHKKRFFRAINCHNIKEKADSVLNYCSEIAYKHTEKNHPKHFITVRLHLKSILCN